MKGVVKAFDILHVGMIWICNDLLRQRVQFLAVIHVQAFQQVEFYTLDLGFGQRVCVVSGEVFFNQGLDGKRTFSMS